MSIITPIHSTLDLVYSEDDGGYYFQDFDADEVSIIYSTKEAALKAYKEDSIKFE